MHHQDGIRCRPRPGRPPADCSGDSGWRIRASSCRRFRPAAARMMASYSPLSSLLSRVPTLPRRERIAVSDGWRPAGTDGVNLTCQRRCRPAVRQSRHSDGDKRVARIVALADSHQPRPSGNSTGTSFIEWTAISARPSSMASSNSFTNKPLPPPLPAGIKDDIPARDHRHQLDLQSGMRLFQRALTYCACHSASGLCRVAIFKTLSNMLVTVIIDHYPS